MYVDAFYNRENEEIWVVERHNGKRHFVEYPVKHFFYYEDPRGNYTSAFGHKLNKYTTKSSRDLKRELSVMSGRKVFESDLNPIFTCLEENYLGVDSPKLNLCFFDIEVDFNPERGFAPPEDPFSAITAISLYLSWLGRNITLALPPKPVYDKKGQKIAGYTMAEAEEIVKDLEDVYLFDDERDMLETFLDLVEDADVLSGWNSTKFDIPYIVRRIELIMSKDHTRKLCLWNLLPKKRVFTKFKRDFITYDLVGRIHMDYLDLYMKHAQQQLHSYRLDYVGEIEVGENKVPYDGTLDDLYKKDFLKFIEYNKQDVMLLVKIDEKNRFIDLANNIAHTNTVLIPTTTGSVALIEQAIINEAHAMGFIVQNRKSTDSHLADISDDDDDDENEEGVAGAYVTNPKVGLHNWIGAVDINSLYPSAIRTFNMGPETLIGQVRQTETEAFLRGKINGGESSTEAWGHLFTCLEFDHIMDKSNDMIWIDFEDGNSVELTGAEAYELIFESGQPWCITANGTIFRTDKQGIIPHLLTRWYKERKEMQAKSKMLDKEADAVLDPAEKARLKAESAFWDQRQYVRKILLNSLYGAILNPYCRFFDQRIGQSVTLSGRNITKHMASTINLLIAGTYDHTGDAIIYGDTDSAYFSAYDVYTNNPKHRDFDWSNVENIIAHYDWVAEETNKTFPGFLNQKFNVPQSNCVIAAGREIVASKGLFITKKRYAALIIDKEGKRLDVGGKPGKIKAMGLDLKRSDTPIPIQKFLEKVLLQVLLSKAQDEIIQMIKEFRTEFRSWDPWAMGSPKKVNSLTDYMNRIEASADVSEYMRLTKLLAAAKVPAEIQKIKKELDKLKKVNLPGNVSSSINYNKLRKMNGDNYSMPISDGSKIIVCKLRHNAFGMKSVAYPIDEPHLPDWFKELPFDTDEMEYTVIDKKLDNLIGVLKWDLSKSKADSTFDDLFSL